MFDDLSALYLSLVMLFVPTAVVTHPQVHHLLWWLAMLTCTFGAAERRLADESGGLLPAAHPAAICNPHRGHFQKHPRREQGGTAQQARPSHWCSHTCLPLTAGMFSRPDHYHNILSSMQSIYTSCPKMPSRYILVPADCTDIVCNGVRFGGVIQRSDCCIAEGAICVLPLVTQEAGPSQYEFAASQDVHASQSLFTASHFGNQHPSQQVSNIPAPCIVRRCKASLELAGPVILHSRLSALFSCFHVIPTGKCLISCCRVGGTVWIDTCRV